MAKRYRVTRRRWGVVVAASIVATAGTGLAIVGSGGTSPDTTAPSLFLTAPAAGATVSGASVTVSATCGDNVGCAGVQFRLDGGNLGAEDTSAPFSITWDSTTATNGTHTLSAVARDAATNTKAATSETVTVSGASGSGLLANLWVNTSAGASPSRCSTACAYNSTNAYGSIDAACSNASAGDRVNVEAGTYTNASDGSVMDSQTDCSHGGGSDTNPVTAGTATPNGWVTFGCPTGAAADSVKFFGTNGSGTAGFYYANFHAVFDGSCFYFLSPVQVGQGGQAANLHVSDLWFRNLHMSTFGIVGGTNILFDNINAGPWASCGKNDANVPATARCDGGGAYFESPWASVGTATGACTGGGGDNCGGTFITSTSSIVPGEPVIKRGDATDPSGILLHNVYIHDQTANDGAYGGHNSCLYLFGWTTVQAVSNIVIDGLTCERVASQGGVYITASGGGVTIENSIFGATVHHRVDSAVSYGFDTTLTQQSMALGTEPFFGNGTLHNILIRYNSFGDAANNMSSLGGPANTYSGVVFTGNIIGPSGCALSGTTGITFDSNAFTNGAATCGTNATSLSANPFTTASSANSGTWSDTAKIDATLNGSGGVPTVNATTAGNLQLGHDRAGATRTSSSHVGAYG